MRELSKSMLRFSWAMPLFAVRQLTNLARPGEWTSPDETTEAFDSVSSAAEDHLGDGFASVFELGDRWQRRTMDLMFGIFDRGCRRQGCGGWSTGSPDAGRGTGESRSSRGAREGWGPMPSVDSKVK